MGELAGIRRVADRYRLTEVIGRGGMGTVWRAEDELLGRVVAVKVVTAPDDATGSGSPDAAGAPARATGRARREARATARLNHPGVVTVHDVVEEDGRVHIIMELVEAPNLAQLVQAEGPLTPSRVAALGGRLLEVLDVAHAAGIVHRDVKPSNVMVYADDRVKLTDFGIAALRGDPQLTASGATLGSPMYMAPEQATGTSVGPAADLWSLGATMYYAVEGRVPFDRPTTMAVLVAVLTEAPDPPRLAGPLAPALTALLVRLPEDRPDGDALRRLLAGAMVEAVVEDVVEDGPGTASSTATVELVTPEVATAELAKTDLPAEPALAEPVAAEPAPVEPVPAEPVAAEPALADLATTEPAGPASATDRHRPADPREPGAPVSRPPSVHRPAGGGPSRAGRGRRRVLAALAAVLAVAIAAVVFALLPDDDDPADRSGSGVTTVQQDDGAAAAGNGAGPTGAAVDRADAAPLAPDAPSDGLGLGSAGRAGLRQVEPTDAGPGGQNLARFFGSVANRAGGYAVGVPQAFEAAVAGPTTFVEWDDSMFRAVFEVRSYQAVDPWARLRQDERQFAREHAGDGYHREQLTRRWTYRGQDAVAWEFTWKLNGELLHAREVAFRVGPRTYTVLYRSVDLWWLGGGSNTWPEDFESSFHPLP